MAASHDQRRRFGRRLRELREGQGLTQPALGALLPDHGGREVSGPAISDYERGVSAPDQQNVAAFESIFGESLAGILGYLTDLTVHERMDAIERGQQELSRSFDELRALVQELNARLQ